MLQLACWLALVAAAEQPTDLLERAARKLASYEAREALALLAQVERAGGLSYEAHVKLYELRGIAHAYAQERSAALEAFDVLLALDPTHAVSYNLSPKVTFLFERARAKAARRQPPLVDLSWPRDLEVQDPIPITVQVVSDPRQFLRHATLEAWVAGQRRAVRSVRLPLAPLGQDARVVLEPLQPAARAPFPVLLYLSARDARGNEVLRVGSAERPRQIALSYRESIPWYRKWWPWALIGGVIAVGAGASVYAFTRAPPDRIDGSFRAAW